MARPPKAVDWEKVEASYRAGVKSLRTIAAEHSLSDTAIRKKAKVCGWQRDLSDKVRKGVRSELIRDGSHPDAKSDAEIVKEAVATHVEVVRGHRKTIAQTHRVVANMLAELDDVSKNQAEIEAAIIEDTTDEDGKVSKRRAMMLKAVDLPSRSSVVVNLSSALSKLVILERQAFNIGDSRGDDAETVAPSVDAFIEQMLRRRERIEATEQA